MFLEGAASDAQLAQSKTLKISLPARLHLQLHSLRVLEGTTISQTVDAALVAYLEEPDAQEADTPTVETDVSSGESEAEAAG